MRGAVVAVLLLCHLLIAAGARAANPVQGTGCSGETCACFPPSKLRICHADDVASPYVALCDNPNHFGSAPLDVLPGSNLTYDGEPRGCDCEICNQAPPPPPPSPPPPPDSCLIASGTDVFASYGAATLLANVSAPADFFAPGSLPFSAPVAFHGSDIDEISMRVERLGTAVVAPSLPPPTIEIELVQLSLVSVAPIVVTYVNGSTQLWDVHVARANATDPHIPLGTMTIRSDERCGCALMGGTFDAVLPVLPLFTFSTAGVDNRTQDGTSLNMTLAAWPWSREDLSAPNSTSDFFAGLLTRTCDSCSSFTQTAFVQRAYDAPFAPLAAWFPIVGGSDEDADGVPTARDNCGALANAAQGDADGDGFGDACDAQPAVNDTTCPSPSGANYITPPACIRERGGI
jgi:hypothetical protein